MISSNYINMRGNYVSIEDKISSITKLKPGSIYVVRLKDATDEDVNFTNDTLYNRYKSENIKFIVTNDNVVFKRLIPSSTYDVIVKNTTDEDAADIQNALTSFDIDNEYEFNVKSSE